MLKCFRECNREDRKVADKDNKNNEKNLSSEETKDKEKKLSAEQSEKEKPADENKKEEKAESKSSDDKAENKTDTDDDKSLLEEDDAGDLILEHRRESIPLNRDNAVFTRSEGNLISLDLTNPDGTTEFFERVVIMRAFPISNPDEFLSVREPDAKRKGRGNEIGMIRRMTDFDDETKAFPRSLSRYSLRTYEYFGKDKFGIGMRSFIDVTSL